MNDDNDTTTNEKQASESQESSTENAATNEQSFGQWMLEQRKLRNISLEEIASVTKIQLGMLKSIEADDYSKLPAPAFIRGFIVNFSRFVGCDEREAVEKFRSQLKKSDSIDSLSAYLGQAASDASASAAASSAASVQANESPKRELTQSGFGKSYNRPSAAMDMDATPIFTPKRILIGSITLVIVIVCAILFSIGTKQAPKENSSEQNSETAAADDSAASAVAAAEAIANTPAPTTTPAPAPVAAAPAPTHATETKKTTEAPATEENVSSYAYHLKLRGLDSSWINVKVDQKGSQGTVLEKGQTKDFYGNQRIVVALSDAGGVEIFWNNKWYQPAGFRGDVKSLNLPDDLSKLKDR